MSRLRTLVLLTLCISGCAKPAGHVDAARGAEAAQTAIQLLADGNAIGLVRIFCYPFDNTMERESRGLINQLLLLRRDFGAISGVKPYRGVPNSKFVAVGGGTMEFWREHRDASRYTYSVVFAKQGPGWIFVDITNLRGSGPVKAIAYALPSSKPGVREFIAREIQTQNDLIE
jgi:hypothetical protein